MMKRNRFLRKQMIASLAIAALAVLVLAACGEKPDDPVNGTAGGQAEKTKSEENKIDLSQVTLVLGDQAGGYRARVEAAKVLEGTPYKIKWANFQGAAPLFEAVRSGEVDTAPAGDTPVLQAAGSNVPIKIVATTTNSSKSVAILVPEDSPIQSIADLKGKTVVVSSAKGSIAQYLLIGALKEAGLTVDDVKISFVLPTDALAAFTAGKIEVWATFDPYNAIAQGQGARVLRDGTDINTGIGFLTASDKALADPGKRAAIQDVLQRFAKAWDWSNRNLDEYAKVYQNQTRLEEDVAKAVVGRGEQSFRPVTDDDIKRVQQVSDIFYELQVLPAKVDVNQFVDKTLFAPK